MAGNRKLAHFVERDLRRDVKQAQAARSVPLLGSAEEQAKINPARRWSKRIRPIRRRRPGLRRL